MRSLLPISLPFLLLTLCASTPAPPPDASTQFLAQLALAQSPTSVSTHFSCEKSIPTLESPILSSGSLLADLHENSPRANLRTLSPYTSQIIFKNDKTFSRSLHESAFFPGSLTGKPGLTLVTYHLALFHLGNPGQSTTLFAITRPAPHTFLLTTTNPDLKKLATSLTLSFHPTTHRLTSAEILTPDGDRIRYTFSHTRTNEPLPADTFLTQPSL